MNLEQVLDLHRTRYLDHFVQSVQRLGGHASEVMMELGNYAPHPLYKMYRVDYLREEGDQYQVYEFNLKGKRDHPLVSQQVGDCTVNVLPFEWNHCVIQVLCARMDRQALEAWATHWIDEEDTRNPDAEGLKQVIHHISPPTYPLGKLTFGVDFGTAPVKAVMELIQLLQLEKGTESITIGVNE